MVICEACGVGDLFGCTARTVKYRKNAHTERVAVTARSSSTMLYIARCEAGGGSGILSRAVCT